MGNAVFPVVHNAHEFPVAHIAKAVFAVLLCAFWPKVKPGRIMAVAGFVQLVHHFIGHIVVGGGVFQKGIQRPAIGRRYAGNIIQRFGTALNF